MLRLRCHAYYDFIAWQLSAKEKNISMATTLLAQAEASMMENKECNVLLWNVYLDLVQYVNYLKW